jgi:acyl dehydratase
MQFGRYYEEFEVGAVYKHWPGKTVTEYDDHLFCLITMNHHPLHLDVNYAEKTTDFGRNVVVGNYIYSLLLGMSVPDVSGKAIANLEIESLRHVAPTFHGEDGTVVCIFRRKVMVPKRSYGEARGGEQPGRPEPLPRP